MTATTLHGELNLSTDAGTFGMSNLGNTGGTTGVVSSVGNKVLFVGGSNVTISQSLNANSATLSFIAASQTVQPIGTGSFGVGTGGNTAGSTGQISGTSPSVIFVAQGALSASQSTAAGAATISLSAPAQTVQPIGTGSFGVSTIGNTAGTTGQATGTSPSIVFAALGALSASQSLNGASGTISLSAPAQTVQPIGTGSFGMSNVGNTAGTSGQATGTSPSVVFVASGAISASQSVNGASATLTLSAPAQTIQPIGTGTFGSNAAGSSVSGTSPAFFLAANGNITFSASTSSNSVTMSISALPEGTVSIGMSNVGNTAGTSGQVTGTSPSYVFAGAGIATLSQSTAGNAGTLTISVPAESNSFGMSNLGATAGTSGTISGSNLQLYFAGTNGMLLSQSVNGNSATISIQQSFVSTLSLYSGVATASQTMTTGQFIFCPFNVSSPIKLSALVAVGFANFRAAGIGSVSVTYGGDVQIFSSTGSTLSNVATASFTSSGSAVGTGVGSVSIAPNGAFSVSNTCPQATLSPGIYWIALHGHGAVVATATSNATQTVQLTLSLGFQPLFGSNVQLAQITNFMPVMGQGSWTSTGTGFTSIQSLLTSDVAVTSAQLVPVVQLRGA